MKQEVLIGQTDYSVFVYIPDAASTDGSGKTGLVAANLTVSGLRMETDNDATVIDYTSSLNDLAAITTAHTDWGVKEISSTLAPGVYRLDIADALFASGAWSCVVYVMVTTSAAAASPMEFVLTSNNPWTGVLAANAITRASFAADTGLQSIRSNTAQAGAASTITLDASASAVDNFYIDTSILLTGGTGAGQFNIITGYVGATKVATVRDAWATNPDNTTTFAIFPAASDAVAIAAAVWDLATSGHTTSGTFGERATRIPNAVAGAAGGIFIAGTNAATTITTSLTTTFTGSLTGSVASVSGAVGSVTGNVGGNVTGTVGTVNALAANSVTAASLAADAVDEILDDTIGDGTVTVRQALRVLLAGMAGKISGAAGTTVTIRNTADSADVIVATVDASGNRSAVTVTP